MKKTAKFLIFFFFVTILSSRVLICSGQKKEQPSRKNELSSLEWKLFELINKEREKLGLSSLSFSPDLSLLARKHSKDMASRGKISHFSTSGKSYQDRLVEAGFYFISIGENVAFSSIPRAEPIHQKLMDSPGHRENILDPSFDQVGIGAAFNENKGYFVTQDFRRAPVLKDENEVKKEIQKEINALRRKNFLPPLIFQKDADEYALRCSLNTAKDRPPPPLPPKFGDTHFHFITSPSLEGIQPIYKDKILDRIYEIAGVGVSFDRNNKYPGGTYFITLLLFPENKYKSKSNKELKQIVLQAVDKVRRGKGRRFLTWDKELTTSAEETLEKIINLKTQSEIIPPRPQRTAILFFITKDPTTLPKGIKEKIENEFLGYTKIGIGIRFRKNQKYPRGAFWVSILLEEGAK